MREHELCLFEDLVNRVVATHAAINERFFIDQNRLKEHRSSRGGTRGLPYCAVGRLIFGGLVSAEKTRLSGVQVQCRHSDDKAGACQLTNTGSDGTRLRFTSFAIGWRIQHTLIFLPCLRPHDVLDYSFQVPRCDIPISAGWLVRKNLSSKPSVTANRVFHRHSKPANHERYE